MSKNLTYVDVQTLEELPPLTSGFRYFDFIGGSREFRCFVAPENMPRNKFMEDNESVFDESLQPIYRNNGIIVKQDASFALPGFYIVSHVNHYRSIDEIDEVTNLRLFFVLREIRKGMREQLGIRNIHIYYEERNVVSHNVHYWMVPIVDVQKYPRLYNFDVKAYLDQFLFSQNKEKILEYNKIMKKHIETTCLAEKDNEVSKALTDVFGLSYQVPSTVDFNLNGACNLKCPWCWGPGLHAREELSNEQWKQIAFDLKRLGTKNITVTGGEPLLKQGISELLRYFHDDLSLRVTLSTNGVFLKKRASEILPYVDDIGLPIDGHSAEVLDLMRTGALPYFDLMLENIQFIQETFPSIDITVRTVVSRKNADSVPLIGKTMIERGIDPTRVRWKCYQAIPLGDRRLEVIKEQWILSDSEFRDVMRKVREFNPQFSKISILAGSMHVGRYFHVYPDGEAHVFVQGADGFPDRFRLGNMGKDFYGVLDNLKRFDLTNNKLR